MKYKLFLMLGLIVLGCSTVAVASQPRMLQSYGDWDAYTYDEDGKVCYMASIPKEHKGNYKNRGDIHVLITHRQSENTKNVFSYIAGYTYKAGSDAILNIDGQKFTLFTKDTIAWAPDGETDKKIADAIRTGTSMVVTGTSSKGTSTTDTYSLAGSSGAYERISKECP